MASSSFVAPPFSFIQTNSVTNQNKMAAVVSSSMPNGSSSSMGQYYASKVGELSEVRVILLKLNDSKNETRNEIYLLSIMLSCCGAQHSFLWL
jgi:hypothetical protein